MANKRKKIPILLFSLIPLVTFAQDSPPPGVSSLKDRQLGEPHQEQGERIIYDRALPFLAQEVLDLGFELPNPYGFQVIGYWQEQDLILDNLFISVNDGPVEEIDFVDFGTPNVENITLQAKLDAWLFPFMNIYATVGAFDGDGVIPLGIEVRDLLGYLGLGGVCNGGILEPEFCSRVLTAEALPEYSGENFTIGTNLAMGWGDWFVTLPISYAWSDVDIIRDTVTATNISPRIGFLWDLQDRGTLALYAGGTWLKADVDIAGTVAFDTSGIDLPGMGDETVIDYVIRQKNKDRWNYLLGFNWEASKAWSIQAEAGFGGSRSNFIGSLTYRW